MNSPINWDAVYFKTKALEKKLDRLIDVREYQDSFGLWEQVDKSTLKIAKVVAQIEKLDSLKLEVTK